MTAFAPTAYSATGTIPNNTLIFDGQPESPDDPVVTNPVTAVTLVPANATILGGATRQYTATAVGGDSASQGMTWSTTLGTVSLTGLVTAPAATTGIQSGSVTATSTRNPAKSATVNFTVPALVVVPDPDPINKAPTVKVTILAADQQGNRMSGAFITCILNKVDVDDVAGYVSPEEIFVTADVNGMAVLELWPNERGSQGSKYIFVIENPDTYDQMRIDAIVPSQDCYLHQIAVPVQSTQ